MKMKFFAVSLLALTLCASALAQISPQQGTRDPNVLKKVRIVQNHRILDQPNQLQIELIETEGPLSAMNGDILYVRISPVGMKEPAITWATGINVRNIDKVQFKPLQKELRLIVTEDVYIYPGEVVGKSFLYKIRYDRLRDGSVSEILEVERVRLER